MEAAMRKPEPVDEFAQTEVLIAAEDPRERDYDALSLFAEYERVLARDVGERRDARKRR
jgi:hypothetical protein